MSKRFLSISEKPLKNKPKNKPKTKWQKTEKEATETQTSGDNDQQ